MRKLVLAALAALAIAAPETALATVPAENAPQGTAPASEMQWGAYAAAQRFWGVGDGTPGWVPPGCLSMELVQGAGLTSEGVGASGMAAAVGPPEDGLCWIAISSEPMNWYETCTTMSHELGHVLGHEHSADQRSMMYPGTGELGRYNPVCQEAKIRALLGGYWADKNPRFRARMEAKLRHLQEWRP